MTEPFNTQGCFSCPNSQFPKVLVVSLAEHRTLRFCLSQMLEDDRQLHQKSAVWVSLDGTPLTPPTESARGGGAASSALMIIVMVAIRRLPSEGSDGSSKHI